MDDSIISLRGQAWAHETRLTSPLFIEVPAPSQESERSCICVLGDFASFFDFNIDFVIVVFFVFYFIKQILNLKCNEL